MKQLLMLATVLLAANGFAIGPGPNFRASDYTCAQLRTIVVEKGPVGILMAFDHGTTFDYGIFVSEPELCRTNFGASAGPGLVDGTVDQKSCNVGYRCN